MDRPPIELEIREPTGLELGTFDIFLIRQKLYQGEIHARCQWKDPEGNWLTLAEHAAFAEVMWLQGMDSKEDKGRRISRFGGWQQAGKNSPSGKQGRVRISTHDREKDKSGLLGRFFGKKS